MNIETNNKLITCLIPKGEGVATISALKDEKQVNSANVYSGRSNLFYSGKDLESETLAVVVAEERADEIFDFLYERLQIGTHHRGIIFQCPLTSSTVFTLS
jgi:nitrogen regulatory protein PII